MNENKNRFWQGIRGISILAVIMIHCPSGMEYAVNSFQYNVGLVLRQLILFPVPVFVFLMGMFTNTDQVENNAKKYIFSRGGGDC